MKTTRTPPDHCPHCGYRVDAATSVSRGDAVPKEGDFSVCICCRGVSVFRADRTLRLPTAPELVDVARALAELRP